MQLKNFVVMLALAAGCGSKQSPQPSDGSGAAPGPGPVADPRSEIEQRRDTACDALGPRITACAVEDARAELAAGRMRQADFDANTSPAIQQKNTEAFESSCKVELSSRQVRVLEVCLDEETDCAPLVACLENLNATP